MFIGRSVSFDSGLLFRGVHDMNPSGPGACGHGRQSKWVRRASTLNLCGGVVAAVLFVFFALRAHFSVPYIDDWSFLASLKDHPFTRGLWQLHNEHIIVIPRLLLWLGFWIWGWPEYATLIAALLSHATILAVFVFIAYRGRDGDEARFLTGSVLVLVFLTYELQGAVFPGALLFPLVAAFSTLAIAFLSKGAASVGQVSRSRWVRASAVMSALAMLCLTNGLVVPFVLAGTAWLLRLRRRDIIGFLVLGAAGILLRYRLGGAPSTAFSASPAAIVRFGFALLAGPIASVSPRLAVVIGVVFVGTAVRMFWRVYRERSDTLLAAVVGFVLASAALAAIARAQFDLSVAAESRYAVLAAIGWASLLVLAFRPGSARRPFGKLAVATLTTLTIAAVPLQLFVGRVWAAKADHLGVASLVLTVGVDDEDWIWRIHPLGMSYIEPVLPQLRSRGVKFLNFPDKGQIVSHPSRQAQACTGNAQAIDPGRDVSSGFRVQATFAEPGHQLRILDRDMRVRGLAKPAPVVLDGRATANDFVWAEFELLARRARTDVNWLGFADWGSGPPYSAELLDAAGQLVCEAAVVCCNGPSAITHRKSLVVRGSLPEGWLDAADCTTVGGWLWDPGRPYEPLDVRISTSRGNSLTLTASMFRQDLLESRKGDGRHAFMVSAKDLGLGQGTLRVSASVAQSGIALKGSPKDVVCASRR
jgi:hypothetical protein